MKTIRHTIRCAACPAHITLEIMAVSFAERGKEYVERIAEVEGWSGGKCPVHREAQPP